MSILYFAARESDEDGHVILVGKEAMEIKVSKSDVSEVLTKVIKKRPLPGYKKIDGIINVVRRRFFAARLRLRVIAIDPSMGQMTYEQAAEFAKSKHPKIQVVHEQMREWARSVA